MPGTSTFQVEITNVSKHGFWLLLADEELFLPFADSHGFGALQSSSYVRSSGLLKTTFSGHHWTLTWPLSPYATHLHFH